MTARIHDDNGWFQVRDNPISKSGIFEYLGSEIGAPIPDKVYRVWRPAKELADPACIESFKLVPWVDDHTMLGDKGVPAEYKGVHGVIGEDVYFDGKYLNGNLKVFSDTLSNNIEIGKTELSLGYACEYSFRPGITPDGERYDAIQHTIRGNHLASVDEGRMGKEVAVLDHATITFDSGALVKMKEDEMKEKEGGMDMGEEMTLSQLTDVVKQIMPMLGKMKEVMAMMGGEEKPAMEMDNESMDMEHDAEDMEKESMDEEKDDGMDKKDGMDSAALLKEIKGLRKEVGQLKKSQASAMDSKSIMESFSKRDALASKLEQHVGTFDHSMKTLEEVAAYGVEKLALPCEAGGEVAALNAALHVMPTGGQRVLHSSAMDSRNAPSAVDQLIGGGE